MFKWLRVSLLLCALACSPSVLRFDSKGPPTVVTYGQNPAVFLRGQAAALAPPSVIGGAPSLFVVSPPLPAGLTLDSGSGAISGTANAVASQQTYRITASNAAGAAAAQLSLRVDDIAPANLAYAAPTIVYPRGSSVSNVATSDGGVATSYSVSPNLPAGLALEPVHGTIYGVPTTITAAASYTVTASNGFGATTARVQIAISDALPILTFVGAPYALVVDSAFSSGVPTNSGGQILDCALDPMTSALPKGLALDAQTCALSGVPLNAIAAASYILDVSYSGGVLTISVDISVAAPLSLSQKTATLTAGTSRTFTLTPSGGIAPYSFVIDSGRGWSILLLASSRRAQRLVSRRFA